MTEWNLTEYATASTSSEHGPVQDDVSRLGDRLIPASSGPGILPVTPDTAILLGARTRRFVRQVTVNVLREFARGPASARHPAVDNLHRFALPSDNLVPVS